MSARDAPPQLRPLRGARADRLVTGEAVALDIPAATLPVRAASALIDIAATAVVFVILVVAVYLASAGLSAAALETAVLVVTVSCVLIVPVTIETLTRGRSLGKRILRLRVVRDDGGPIVFRQAFLRGLLGVVEVWTLQGVPALVASAANNRGKRLGDLAAGTYVVRERPVLQLGPAPACPTQLRHWAQRADIAALPPGTALAVRQFLLRRYTLSPAARAALCDNLLAQVLPRVAPPPPAGTPAEDILGAVLAQRRDRDAARLARQESMRRSVLPPDPLGRS